MTKNSRRFVTGKKLKFMDRLEAAFGVSIHLLLLCAAVLQKPTGCTKLNFIYNHRMIQGSIQFYLSFVLFSSDMSSFVAIVTFHLSPSNKTLTKWNKGKRASWIARTVHCWFQKCLNSNQILRFCVFWTLFFLHLFRTIKGNEKPFEKAIEQMMITTTHDDCPKYFDFFWCLCLFYARLKCPFLHRITSHRTVFLHLFH